jgi:TfoX/Sxy family transcriptional regulator of competence genes
MWSLEQNRQSGQMAAMQKGTMPKPGQRALQAFDALVPDARGVSKRPMFGNQAAFVNGNMFTGLFGDRLFVRLADDRLKALMAAGGEPFEPMPGRAMRGYAYVPGDWIKDPGSVSRWVSEALDFTASLPPKEPKKKKA